MNIQRHDNGRRQYRGKTPRWLEMVIFVLASVVGIYGIGMGLAGFYEQGQQISLLWLAVTGIAFFVLFSQMGRVHDTWPRRPVQDGVSAPGLEATPDGGSPDAKEISR